MKKLVLLLVLITCGNLHSQDFWEQTNGPYGGFVQLLAINPSGYIFAETNSNIFRSTDNGENWVEMSLTPGLIFAFEINSKGDLFVEAGGLYRSTDNGDNWTRTGLSSDISVNSIAVNSQQYVFVTTNLGVFVSTDNGDSWTQTAFFANNVNFIFTNSIGDIFVISDGLYRSTDNGENWIKTSSDLSYVVCAAINSIGYIFASSYNGIYCSTDNGDNWIKINSDMTGVLSLAIDSSGYIFAGALDGVFRSTDNGYNWVKTSLDSTYCPSLAINSKGYIFTGSNKGVLRSKDNGDNWVKINNGMIASDVTSLAINSQGHIFAMNYPDGSIFKSTNDGVSWISINNRFIALELGIFPNGYIFSATEHELFRSTDNGENWIETNLHADYIERFLSNQNGYFFAGDDYGHMYRSTDNGINWVQLDLNSEIVNSFAVDSSGQIFIGNYNGIFRSTDNGDSWISTGLSNNFQVYSLAISPKDVIFAGTEYGLYCSTNNGESWANKNTQFSYCIFAFNSNGNVFVAEDGPGILMSSDNGDNWIKISDEIKDFSVGSLAIKPDGYLFAGISGHGVFRSINSTTEVYTDKNNKPSNFSINQNFPNPFNPSTKIEYQLPFDANVKLDVYNIEGQRVAELVNQDQTAGYYSIEFGSKIKLASGVYIYRIAATDKVKGNKYISAKKMILLK